MCAMKIDTLEAYNLPPNILRIWRESIGPELLPVQERAVKEYGLFADGNLIVFSPTSSGKTFIGEMAAVKAVSEKKNVLYLVPQKALAEEKFQELRARYREAGWQVVISSRDRREFDEEIEQGEFQIAVVVFEKAQALFVSKPQLMQTTGLVVVDELQLITDETRGPSLELLLTKLRMPGPRPRIVGLSAVLGRAETLAKWLGARLLVETSRPVELRKGVLCQGTYHYREHNTGAAGEEPFRDYGTEKRRDLVLGAAEDLVGRGEQVLVFLPDRASTVASARILAGRVRQPALDLAMTELRDHEETHAQEALMEVLASSVAFHNSDLSPEERQIVERHFRSGAIKALLSTSTLAMGMNLPVKNVVLEGKCWRYLKRFRRWSLEDITKSEYENMSGRAGRLALSKDFGRSFLVTSSPFNTEVWMRYYVESDFEDIVPTLKDSPLEDHVINLVASGLASSAADLRELLLSSYTGFMHWSLELSREEFLASLEQAIQVCLAEGLACETETGIQVTSLGRACATKGIDVRTCVSMAAWAREALDAAVTEIEVLAILGNTRAGRDVYVSMSSQEHRCAGYREQALRRAADTGVAGRPIFHGLAEEQMAVQYDMAKILKKALFLCDWIDEVATKDIERRYQVWAGALRRVGEEYSWLVEALATVADACGWPDPRCKELVTLADRLSHGVRAEAMPLARLRVRGLGRVLLRRLLQAGLDSPEAILAAGEKKAAKALNHRGVFKKLWARLTEDQEPAEPARYPEEATGEAQRAAEPEATYEAAGTSVPGEPELVVNLRERVVSFRGRQIPTRPPNNLQRQPLLALAVLAGQPGEAVSMSDLAEAMFTLGGLAKRQVAPDARDLRYKILRPFKKALNGTLADDELAHLVESIPEVGIRLNLPAGSTVVITADNQAA